MSVPERVRKVEKIIEELRRQLENEPMIFDERFTGTLTVTFNMQSGGISGDVASQRKGKIATA